jgi:calcium-dependent protein kinase
MGCGIYRNRREVNCEVSLNDTKLHQTHNRNMKKYDETYEIIEPIGEGAFGKVFKIIHKQSNEIRAMKIISKNKKLYDDKGKVLKEIEILSMMDHPNILKIYEYYEDEQNYYMITEYINGIELKQLIDGWRSTYERKASIVFRQILLAVDYLHLNKIIHRDIKPENILVVVNPLDEYDIKVKLIDFGSANFSFKKKLKLRVGTPSYVAPEVIDGCYNDLVDEWSCGVVLYLLLIGYHPFSGQTSDELYDKIKEGSYYTTGPGWDYISQEALNILSNLLKHDPRERVKAGQCLQHEWIRRYVNNGKNYNNY